MKISWELKEELLRPCTTDLLGQMILCCTECPGLCKMFSGTCGLYLLHDSRTHTLSYDNQNHLQTLPHVPGTGGWGGGGWENGLQLRSTTLAYDINSEIMDSSCFFKRNIKKYLTQKEPQLWLLVVNNLKEAFFYFYSVPQSNKYKLNVIISEIAL